MKVFSYVNRTGSSLRRQLVRAKDMALGSKGKTTPCEKARCKTCPMITDMDKLSLSINNEKVTSTYNIIYLFMCSLCSKCYVGRTVSPLNIWTNQHRSAFYKVLNVFNECRNLDSLMMEMK